MGLTKSDKFTIEENRLANIFKAIGHPARIAILHILIKRKACVCGDIVEDLPLSQSTISQHLAALKNVGLIKGTISGPSICYCINTDVWNKTKIDINILMNMAETSKMAC